MDQENAIWAPKCTRMTASTTHIVLKWSFTFASACFIDCVEVCLVKVHLIEFFRIQDFHSSKITIS